MKKLHAISAAVSGAAVTTLTAVSVFAATAVDPTRPGTFFGGAAAPTSVTGGPGIIGIVTNGINFFLGVLGLIAVIVILMGGFKWMTASSAEDAKKARAQLIQGLIGLVVILLAWSIAFGVISVVATNIATPQ